MAVGSRPNVLFVLCDDLGFGDLGVTWQLRRAGQGQPAVDTPHVDALAAKGALLTNHSSGAPVCAPARANLLLGQHQGTCAVRDNMFDVALPGEVPSLATLFGAAGYRCAAFGKWGLTGDDDRPGHPLHRGFDEFFGYLDHVPAHYHVPGQRAPGDEPLLFEGFEPVPNADLGLSYSPDLFTARAKHFIEQNAGDPWFLYLAYDTPHAELELPSMPYPEGGGRTGGLRWTGPDGDPRWVNTNGGAYDAHLDAGDASWPEAARRHATIVRRLDHAVGDLLTLLEDLHLTDDTVVVFTSDNGPHGEGSERFAQQDPAFFEGWGPYDGMKRDVLQGGHIVPTVVWGPGRVRRGLRDATPSAFCDWMATFAEWTGQPVPASCDGESLAPILAGDQPAGEERAIYVEYAGPNMGLRNDEILDRHGLKPDARAQQQSIQVGDLVALRYEIRDADTPVRLYDVRADPAQTRDLADHPEYAGVVRWMGGLLLTSRRARRGPGSGFRSGNRPYDDTWLPASPAGENRAGLLAQALPLPDGVSWLPRGGASEDAPHVRSVTGPVGPGHVVMWTGMLQTRSGGQHELVFSGTAEVAFWIHGTRHLDPTPLADGAGTVRVPLAPGRHPIRLVARSPLPGQPAELRLRWRAPGSDALVDVPDETLVHLIQPGVPPDDSVK